MIFLSHQHKDKEFVRFLAVKLAKIFGKEKIFYDDWSIRPGESIPGEMSKGLESVSHFFYFLTKNSIKSVMVEREWHSAFIKSVKDSNVKFVVVRADDVDPPALLESSKYIDLYMNGLDLTLDEMKEVISGEYNDDLIESTFHNHIAYYQDVSNKEIIFYVTAKRFFIPNAPFLLAAECDNGVCSFEPGWPCINAKKFIPDVMYDGKTNGFVLDVQTGIRPGNYLKLIFRKRIQLVTIRGLFHAKTNEEIIPFELKRINSEKELP